MDSDDVGGWILVGSLSLLGIGFVIFMCSLMGRFIYVEFSTVSQQIRKVEADTQLTEEKARMLKSVELDKITDFILQMSKTIKAEG